MIPWLMGGSKNYILRSVQFNRALQRPTGAKTVGNGWDLGNDPYKLLIHTRPIIPATHIPYV